MAGKEYRYDVLVSDADHDAIAFDLVAGPAGLSLDPTRGTMRWIPAKDQFGPATVSVRATDAYGALDEQTFTITVRAVGGPPAITSVPETRAAVGIGYLYSVMARDAENDPLTYSLLVKPSGMTIQPNTGEIAWTPSAEQFGQNQVVIQVSDGVGGFATQAFSIRVSAGATNQPPTITDVVPLYASVGTTLNYQIHASDPEGSTLTYQLRRGPSSISVNSSTGVVTWTPIPSEIGLQVITLAAFDSQGAAAVLSFEIEVLAANIPPVIQTQPVTKGTARGLYRYDVIATDQNLDPLSYTLIDAPAGMTVDAFGRLRWQTNIADLGLHRITLQVSDPRGGVATQPIAVNIVPDTTPPKVSVIPLQTIVRANSPEVFAKFNLTPIYPTNRVRVSAVDDVGVTNLEVTAEGQAIALDANGFATFKFEDWGFGSITIVAKASDAAGNITTTSRAFAFLPYGDDPGVSGLPEPSVVITSPVSGSNTRGVVSIRGSATSDNFTSYKLSVRSYNGISTGNVVAGDFDIPDSFTNATFTTLATGTSPISDGLLGTWDTTLLENGEYVLRLESEDDIFGTTVYEANVSVTGDLKLGNFRVSFSDLTIPVAGIPITIARTYDTLQADRTSELGYGWKMEFRNTDLRTSLPKTGLESYGIYSAFTQGTKVYVTLPGGTREGFTFTPDIRVLPGFGGRLVIATPRFTPDRGANSTLTVRSGTFIVNENGELMGGGGQPYNPAAEEFGGGYTVTTRDGTQYRIDGDSGLLTTVIDRNNNQISFSETGVSGSGTSVSFQRDLKGRITKVTDPAGNSITYQYDSKGDLVQVTDRLGNVTKLTYLSSPQHYLKSIIDPLGRTGVRTEYQADGRLQSVSNSTHTTNQLSYNVNTQFVTTTDGMGNVSTIGYDNQGNVTSMTDPLGRTTTMLYDEQNQLISSTDALGNITKFSYDSSGNVSSVTDALGNRTAYTYDASGKLTSTVDALGRSTRTSYDARGNAVQFTDASGAEYNLKVNSQGLVTEVVDPLQRRTQYVYSPQGYLTSTVTPDGTQVDLENDTMGKVLRETQKANTPDGLVTRNLTYQYDANGNFTGATDPNGVATSIAYDAAGSPTSSIDTMGGRTSIKWNENGLQSGSTLPVVVRST